VRAIRYVGHAADAVLRATGHLPPAAQPTSVIASVIEGASVVRSTPTPGARMRRLDPSRPPAVWKPLDADTLGEHQLTHHDIAVAFDRTRPRSPTSITVRPPPCPYTPATRDFVDDMIRLSLAEEVCPTAHPPTGTLFIVPKNDTKSRAILDCRYANASQALRPRSFTLPSFESIKPLLRDRPLFVIADVASYYQSLRLPDSAPSFIFHTDTPGGVRAFRLLHLPFGWDAAPFIAQRLSEAIVRPLRRPGVFPFPYLDDILILGRDHASAAAAGRALDSALRAKRLFPNPKKTHLDPARSVEWLGKVLHSDPPSIAPQHTAAGDAIALAVLLTSAPLSAWKRGHLTGCLVWATAQHRLALPFLGSLHRWNPPHPLTPPRSLARAAITAAVVASVPWRDTGICSAVSPGVSIFFDGVASPSGAAAAAFLPPSVAIRIPLPLGTDQQQAELAAALLALRLALPLPCATLVGDSTSALGGLRRLSTAAANAPRLRLLEEVAWTLLASRGRISLAWLPSALNPADPIVRDRGRTVGLVTHPAPLARAQLLAHLAVPSPYRPSPGPPARPRGSLSPPRRPGTPAPRPAWRWVPRAPPPTPPSSPHPDGGPRRSAPPSVVGPAPASTRPPTSSGKGGCA